MDRPTYAWWVEDQMTSGTLERYARDCESGEYAGIPVSSHVVRYVGSGEPESGMEIVPAEVKYDCTSHDIEGSPGYAYYIVTVGDDKAYFKIDLRV